MNHFIAYVALQVCARSAPRQRRTPRIYVVVAVQRCYMSVALQAQKQASVGIVLVIQRQYVVAGRSSSQGKGHGLRVKVKFTSVMFTNRYSISRDARCAHGGAPRQREHMLFGAGTYALFTKRFRAYATREYGSRPLATLTSERRPAVMLRAVRKAQNTRQRFIRMARRRRHASGGGIASAVCEPGEQRTIQ